MPAPRARGVPQGYVLRPLTFDDIPAAQRVLDDAESFDCGEPRRNELRLAVEFRDPRVDLARDAWTAVAADGAPAAVAWVEPPHASGEIVADVCVHPEHRGRGLVDTLLDAVEARAGELAVASAPGARSSLVMWAETIDAALRESLVRRGFSKVRDSFEMRLDLQAEPGRPDLPDGIAVRPLRVGHDEPAVHLADAEAFAEHFLYEPRDYDEWRMHHVDHPDFNPGLWLIAWDGDEVAGYVCAYIAEDGAIVADLAVRRPWRRRGLGRALLALELRALWAHDGQVVRLYVDAQNETGAVRLYEEAGMRVARRFDVFEKMLR
jgi:mycothiol synthase